MDEPRITAEAGWEEGASALEIRTYEEGEIIVSEGEASDHFFVILSGTVKLSRKGTRLCELQEGDLFGMEGVLLEQRAAATARAVDKARVATYGAEAFDFVLYQSPQMVKRVFASILKQLVQTIRVAGYDETVPRLGEVEIKFFNDGDTIIEQGATDTDIYRLVSTERGLRVTRDGRELGIIRSPGEFFGEMAALLGQRRSATVTSLGESVVQVYRAEQLEDLILDDAAVAKRIIISLAQRLSTTIRLLGRLQSQLEAAKGSTP